MTCVIESALAYYVHLSRLLLSFYYYYLALRAPSCTRQRKTPPVAGQRFPALLGSSRKTNPKKIALTREKQKKDTQKTPKNTKKHQKNTKKTPNFFFALTRDKKKPPPNNFRAYARKK